MQLAFRRDYTWGAFFNEQWRDTNNLGNGWQQAKQNTDCNNGGITCFGDTDTVTANSAFNE